MKKISLLSLALALATFAGASEPDSPSPPPEVVAQPSTEGDAKATTALMRRMAAARDVSKKWIRTPALKEPYKPFKLPGNFWDIWNNLPTLAPEEAIFAYECVGDIGAYAVPTHEWLLQYIDKEEVDVSSTTNKGFSTGYLQEIQATGLKIRYARDKKEQAAQLERVNAAAVAAAVRVMRAYHANRVANPVKEYPNPTWEEIEKQNPKLSWSEISYRSNKARNRMGEMRDRAMFIEKTLKQDEVWLARIFVKFLPGQKDKVREALVASGYPKPEDRAAYWKRVGQVNEYYFNAEHIALVYDPTKP